MVRTIVRWTFWSAVFFGILWLVDFVGKLIILVY